MGKRAAEENEEEVAAAALAAKKAAKKAKKAAAAAEAAAQAEEEEAAAVAARKAAKKAKKAAAAAAAEPEAAQAEDEEAAALAARKAAKKAKKAAAAAAAEPEAEEADPDAAALAAKKAAKKAKKAAAAAAAAAEEEAEAPAPKKKKTDEAAPEPQESNAGPRSHDNENTVFVRGLPFATTQEALNKDFGECGEIVSLRMPLNDEGSCKGIAFIKYAAKEGMDKAIAFNETDYGGRTIYCAAAADNPGGKGKGKDGKGKDGKGKGHDNENTLFVRGLPFSTTEEALKKDFGECGEIVSLRMPLNDEGSCRGIAFIKYVAKEGMDKGIAFNETDYGGRTIYCTAAADNAGGKGKDGKGKDGKGKGKDGKGKKGKKGKASSEAFAKNTGAMVESTGTKQTFDDSD